MTRDFAVVIMAGGEGKRFGTGKIKVLHEVLGKPMIVHLLHTVQTLDPTKIIIVVGRHRALIEETVTQFVADTSNIVYVDQSVPQGTGHALQCCIPELENLGSLNVIILSGDTPMIQSSTIQYILNCNHNATVVTRNADDDKQLGAGRIILDDCGKFHKIVEEVDASHEEKKITVVNTGIYCVPANLLVSNLPLLSSDNKQNEYYLTDVIKLIKDRSRCEISLFEVPRNRWYEVVGVNTPDDLTYLLDGVFKNN